MSLRFNEAADRWEVVLEWEDYSARSCRAKGFDAEILKDSGGKWIVSYLGRILRDCVDGEGGLAFFGKEEAQAAVHLRYNNLINGAGEGAIIGRWVRTSESGAILYPLPQAKTCVRASKYSDGKWYVSLNGTCCEKFPHDSLEACMEKGSEIARKHLEEALAGLRLPPGIL